MTAWLLGLVPSYGVWLLAMSTFLSCLALPIPASLLMLAAGGFAAAGDLPPVASGLAALAGAVAGDQAGFLAGRRGGGQILAWVASRAGPVAQATRLLRERGDLAVFLSRWLLSALGPYVNLAAGAAGLGWSRFTAWGVAGEAVWVGLYIGTGYAVTDSLQAASQVALQVLGLLSAGAIALALGAWLLSLNGAEVRRSG